MKNMIKKNKKVVMFISLLAILILVMVVLGPLDIFKHGFYCDLPSYEEINEEDIQYIDLAQQDYESEFMPIKKYFSGFGINLTNIQTESTGELCLSIYDVNRILLEEINVNLCDIKDKQWFFLYTNTELKKGDVYTLHISAKECQIAPYLQIVSPYCLTDENVSGNLLLGYAYAEPTFTLHQKVLICMLILSLWALICARLTDRKKYLKKIRLAAIFLFFTAILSWNYMYNSMDNKNIIFGTLSSDNLVLGMIEAQKDGISIDKDGYGLAIYENTSILYSDEMSYPGDNNWIDGYLRNEACICIPANGYTRNVARAGNFVKFSNGELLRIKNIVDDGKWLNVYLESDKFLRKSKYGKLSDIVFYDENYVQLENARFIKYGSQYGLQGKIFSKLGMYMSRNSLYFLCSLATAAVFSLIVILLYYRYNLLFSGCFFTVFFLSPWVITFASSLYWVEFTWFIPMAIGLFCAWRIADRKCRFFSYCTAYVAVTVKCLCGYEYISVIMMGMISFLLIDFVVAYIERKKGKQKLLLQTIFILGTVSLAGFVTAVCIHANLRGAGNILEGIKNIIMQDVLRRTNGSDLNSFEEVYWESLNASVWEVCCKYFHFSTELITGIEGNLFPLLCIVPLGIFVFEYKKRMLNAEMVAMYVVFFFTCISWFVLAKSHSYIHTQLNYVLWYFGYIQVCIYIICNRLMGFYNRKTC